MNKETMQTPIKRDLALGAVIMVLLVALFFVFSRLNQARIIRQNEGYVQDEIARLARVCHDRDAILKVILETCFLSDAQKAAACRLSELAGADFVKTSTGYGSAGANVADVRLMRRSVSSAVRVKASGGIRSLDAVLAYRAAGASRCGVSATVAIMQEAEKRAQAGTLTMDNVSDTVEGGGAY